MLIDNGQQVRLYVDSLLQITKDGLARSILSQYKGKYGNTNHMIHIREALKKASHEYAPDIFTNEEVLLSSLDPQGWLALMLRRWDILFSKKFGSAGRRHVERLREIRNQLAHPTDRPITLDQAKEAAESAIYLLEACGSQQCVEEIRAIHRELSHLQAIENQNHETPSPNDIDGSGANPLISKFEPELLLPDGDTQTLEPIQVDAQFQIEIIAKDGQVQNKQLPIDMDRVIIGRGTSSHIFLNDPRVSRAHLLIMRNSSGLILTDLFSANGTKLDGKKLKPNEPNHWGVGKVVVVGDTWLILRRCIN